MCARARARTRARMVLESCGGMGGGKQWVVEVGVRVRVVEAGVRVVGGRWRVDGSGGDGGGGGVWVGGVMGGWGDYVCLCVRVGGGGGGRGGPSPCS